MPSRRTSRRGSASSKRRRTDSPTPRHCSRPLAAAGGIGRSWRAQVRDKALFKGAFGAALAVTFLAGCSSSPDRGSGAAASVSNLRLTKEQRAHIQLYAVVPVAYRQTIEAPGTVDFDNDQATSVVSPFTGPVTQIFVALGQRVAKGQPLAAVASADVTTAVGAYPKAAAAAAHARRAGTGRPGLGAPKGI